MAVLRPDQFNEGFTLYLNTEGNPVQRTLQEMKPGEVMAAMKWHTHEAARLERECAPFIALAEMVEAGNPTDDVPDETMECAATAMRQAGEANEKAARLIHMVHTKMPQWRRHSGMRLGDALRRFWPGGDPPDRRR